MGPRGLTRMVVNQAHRQLCQARPAGFEPATFGFEVRDDDAAKSKSRKALRRCDVNVAHQVPTDTCKTDPDLAAIVAGWPKLPEAIKAGILAMVKASLP
jgi:hypothetical protein